MPTNNGGFGTRIATACATGKLVGLKKISEKKSDLKNRISQS
jgi:hypothetical protein